MHSNHLAYSISLKEQEDVQAIISQLHPQQEYTLDPDLEALILSSEADIQAAYDAQAEERMLEHRQGIDFEQLREQIEEEEGQQLIEESAIKEQRELVAFERESVLRSKLTQRQILELDSQFPKLNYNSMVGQQQSIFLLQSLQASKWTSHRRLNLESIGKPITARIGETVWIVMAIANQLLVFVGVGASQPQVLQHNGNITAIAFSPCKRYLAAAIQSQIVVYEIRKSTNIVLLKNIGDLKIKKIVRIGFYEGGPRLFFVDESSRVGIVCIEIGMILTKVRIDEIVHTLPVVQSCEAIGVNEKGVLMALAGGGKLRLASIQPDIEFMQQFQISAGAQLLWRRSKEKIQLLLACQNKLTIYKLVHMADEQCYFLQQHLLFLNHYFIQSIFLISEYHVLLSSQQNFTVVALPLIPTVVEYPDLLQSQGAIVFVIARQDSNTVLSCADESLVVYWKGQLQLGRLKTLEQSIDELMIHQCAYRQALALLVLVSKGMNYSFKFSYEQQDLKNLISGAIQMSASALMPSLDKKIVLFRVGWVVQLCIECRQEKMMWSSYYQMLKQKNHEKTLFQMLQIFILKNQISSIPQPIFLQMVAFYAERNQEQIIQKLVLTNKEQFEATKLLGLLNQKEMNYLQFYLFSRGILSEEYDFYTPFLRSFTAFTRNIQTHSPKKTESGLLCFLILSKTFCFQHVPNGYMTRDTKETVVKDFFIQTLSKPFLKRLSQFNFRLFCQIYLLPLINEQFKDILFEEENQMFQRLKEMTIEEDIKADTFISLYLQHVQTCIGANRNSSIFAQFYASILYITDSTAKFQRIIEILAILFQKKFYRYQLQVEPQVRPPTKKLKEYLIKIIQQQLCARSDRLYIKKLLVFQDREVGYLLHRIDRNYQLSLEHYLGNQGTDGLFAFIQSLQEQAQKLPQDSNYQKTRKKLQIRNFLIRNIGLLFRTDSLSALEILYTVGQTTQKIHDHIFNAHFQKQQKLHFLTAVLTRWQSQQFQHKQKYLLEHLEQVCGLPQKEMREYLDRFYYPLDQAIRVADQKGNYLAKAILQTRSGMIQEAFSSYEKLIKNTLTLNKGQEETRAKVNRYIEECVELCKLFSGQSFEENLWIRLMKFISSFVASEHQYKVYLKVQLQRSNQAIIAEMLRFLGTQLLIAFFTSPSIPLPFYKLAPIHEELIRKVKFDKIIIQRTQLIFKRDLQQLRQQISRVSRIAPRIQDFCDFCKGKLSQQQTSIAFSCSHSFHTICHDDHSMCLTCIYQSDDLLFQKAIFKKNQPKRGQSPAKKKKREEINTDIIVQTKSEAMIEKSRKKLKFYDYQVDAAWSKISNLANNNFEIDSIVYYM